MISTDRATQKSGCLHCGNNPVNHTSAFLSQSLAIFLGPFYRLFAKAEVPCMQHLAGYLLAGLVGLLRILGMVRFKSDITKVASDRSRVIWEEAERRGIRMEQAYGFGKPLEQYRAYIQGRWHYFMSLPIPYRFDTSSQSWMDNKALLKKFFRAHGVRVPRGGHATSLSEAERIFDTVENPVIVKPEIGSRGRHTVTHIHTKEELRRAFKIAQQLCYFVVVEEHLVGSVYRATYVGGEVVGMLRGDPPRVTGDGNSTVAELILKKNASKHVRQKDFKTTATTPLFLARQGYALDTVLEKGKTIDLVEKIGLSYGGFAVEDFWITHQKLLARLTEAGDLLKTPIVGFDVISEDVTQDPDTVRWGIIEANTLPFIDLHHFPVEGEPINVAGKVWDLWK